ncbi:fluoride efflux transporter CrcB [Nocardioides sp. GY 10113]|uniref:fluoride efflux transporter CrcB n=1 Tax=Nocardioides sp. GY 10113 TaxID=2569761 RepID=UPI0010A91CA8|nr:fluoride efflux transporter CrcB [Nocardioides sp. GY 10113]TIC88344.1 fluoride efflux transporter CrcB [Nocardioides sp. GY 10113]
MTALMVLLGGAIGAPSRYAIDLVVRSRARGPYPWGTFAVNVAGSLLLGLLAGLAPATWLGSAAGTGFCGALTTFSTFGFEAVRLVEDGRWRTAAWYVGASLVVGLAAVSLGWWIGSRL